MQLTFNFITFNKNMITVGVNGTGDVTIVQEAQFVTDEWDIL
jgi:hypothetical protein